MQIVVLRKIYVHVGHKGYDLFSAYWLKQIEATSPKVNGKNSKCPGQDVKLYPSGVQLDIRKVPLYTRS